MQLSAMMVEMRTKADASEMRAGFAQLASSIQTRPDTKHIEGLLSSYSSVSDVQRLDLLVHTLHQELNASKNAIGAGRCCKSSKESNPCSAQG